MDTAELKKLGDEASKATVEMRALITKGEKVLDGFDEVKFKKIEKDILGACEAGQKANEAFKAEETARKKLETEFEELKSKASKDDEAATKRIDELEVALKRLPTEDPKAKDAELSKKWNRAFNEFARKGGENRRDLIDFVEGVAEFKDLVVGSQPDGGFAVTPVMMDIMTKRVFETSPMRQLADQMTITSGDAVEFPLDNDEIASGGWVGETQSRPTTGTPKLGAQRIPICEQYANPRVTQKMLDDAGFDVEAWIGKKIADKFERFENSAFINGTGGSIMPTGILAYPDLNTAGTFQTGAVERIQSGVSGDLGGYSALSKLQWALKDNYEGNACFLGKRATLGALMLVKDGQSRPIFDMTYNGRGAKTATILGKDFVMADDMPVVAANALALAYGDFKQAYLIVDRIGIRTLRDPYTAKPYIQFYTTKRVGGDVVNYEAYKLLQISA